MEKNFKSEYNECIKEYFDVSSSQNNMKNY